MAASDTVAANKALVLKAITGVFVDRNPAVLDELFSSNYRQHNPQIPNGTDAIRSPKLDVRPARLAVIDAPWGVRAGPVPFFPSASTGIGGGCGGSQSEAAGRRHD